MKKFPIVLITLLVLCVAVSGCNNSANQDESTSVHSASTTNHSASTTRILDDKVASTNAPWKAYPPNMIHLSPNDLYLSDENWYGCVPKYREIYYRVSPFGRVVDNQKAAHEMIGQLSLRHIDSGIAWGEGAWFETDEMDAVAFIKHFDVPRELAEKAIEELHEYVMSTSQNVDVYDEFWEVPNLDIIYTFDNEIINAYYRRENPVEPDWSKTTTYESYAAYKEAN